MSETNNASTYIIYIIVDSINSGTFVLTLGNIFKPLRETKITARKNDWKLNVEYT